MTSFGRVSVYPCIRVSGYLGIWVSRVSGYPGYPGYLGIPGIWVSGYPGYPGYLDPRHSLTLYIWHLPSI